MGVAGLTSRHAVRRIDERQLIRPVGSLSRVTTGALALALCLVALVAGTTACGSSTNDASPASTTPATPPTDTPARRRVYDDCRRAQLRLERVGKLVTQDSAELDYATVAAAVEGGAAPVAKCQEAVEALFPELSAALQSTASSYAGSLDAIIVALEAPPADAAQVQPWVEQLSAAAAETAEQTKAMNEADPTILG